MSVPAIMATRLRWMYVPDEMSAHVPPEKNSMDAAPIMPHMASMEPTERSMPPVMMM